MNNHSSRFVKTPVWKRLTSVFGALVIASATILAAFAETVAPTAPQRGARSVNLDLSSTTRSSTAPRRLGGESVSIRVGDTVRSITSATALTAAERVAVWQVLSTGQQSIHLSELGNAVGGSFNLGSWAQNVNTLTIPQGVLGTNSVGSMNVAGNLTNLGVLNIAPTNATSATIYATNIYNGQGAVINSLVPLTLSAVNDIVNAGLIGSNASLALNAGGSITNALPAGVTGANPVMQAISNIDIFSGAGSILNSGLISSTNGNINFTAAQLQNLTVDNVGGILQALNGAINVRDAAYTANTNLALVGGDWLSKELNAFSGSGNIDLYADDLTGIINMKAGEIHMGASTDNLVIGDVCATGDPTFYNSAGNIQLSGNLSYSASVAFLADGNITLFNNSSLTTNNSGGTITMIAGANWTGGPAGNNLTLGRVTTGTAGNNANAFTGITSSGGTIDLVSGATFSNMLSNSTTTNAGGDIVLIGGAISLPAITINSGGAAGRNNGNVTIIATTGNISAATTNINTSSGNTGTGSVTIASGAVDLTGFSILAGGRSSGSISMSSTGAGSISVGAITTRGADVSVTSGNNTITVGTINTSSTTGAGGNVAITTNGNNGDITTAAITTSSTANNQQAGRIVLTTAGTSANISNGANTLTANSDDGFTQPLLVPTIDINAGGSYTNTNAAALRANAISGGNGGYIRLSMRTSNNVGSIEANGAGTGNGGRIDLALTANAATEIGRTGAANRIGTLSANAGTTGAGGTVLIDSSSGGASVVLRTNISNTPITVNSGSGVSGGNGGIIGINTGSATLDLNGATLNILADATGNGSASTDSTNVNGGNAIRIIAGIVDGNTGQQISAQGSGNGSGGNISITMNAAAASTMGTINSSSGSTGGTAGTINISAVDDLTTNTITANAFNGFSGLINPTVSIIANADLRINAGTSSILSNAISSGNGGWISVSFNTTRGMDPLAANGAGTGNGGQVDLAVTSTTAVTLGRAAGNSRVDTISAVAAGTSGNGGTILVTTGDAAVTLYNTVTNPLNVAAAGANGNGGIIGINTGTAALTISSGVELHADATGNGSASIDPSNVNGGNAIQIVAGRIIGNANNDITARGGTVAGNSGNGGDITLTLGNVGASIVGDLISSGAAAGGSAGNIIAVVNNALTVASAAADGVGGGGSVTLNANGNLTVSSAVTARGTGATASGGDITLTGTQVQINGNIDASGTTTGNGGDIDFTYNNAGTLTIGSATAPNYVNGTLKTTTGTGTPGNITISDANASNMVVSLNTAIGVAGTIETRQTAGTGLGLISFVPAAPRSLSVTGSAANRGDLIGQVTATATTVVITPRLNNSQLTLGNITATAVGSPAIQITNNNSTGASVTIASGATVVASNPGIGNVDINTPTVNNNGTITSTGGSVTLHHSGLGGLSIGGANSGAVNAKGGIVIRNENNAAANNITFSNSQVFTPGAGQNVVVDNTGGSALGLTVTLLPSAGGLSLSVSNGALNVSTVPANSALTVALNTTSNSVATINAGGGINITSTGSVVLNTTAGLGTINFDGGATTMTAAGNLTNSITIASDNTISATLAPIGTAIFTNNGTFITTMSGGNITIQSPNSLTVAGNGTITANVGPTPYIWINANSGAGGAANTLSFTGNQTLNIGTGQTYVTIPGTSTALNFGATSVLTVNATSLSGGAINNLPYTLATYPYLNLSAPTITFNTGATVAATGSAFITIDSGCFTCNITINAPTGSSATLSTANGMPIYVAPQSNALNITYGQTGVGTATLNFNGYFFSFNQAPIAVQTVNAGVTIASNNHIQFAVEGSGTFTNNGTVSNSNPAGQIVVEGGWGNLNMNGTGTLNATAIMLTSNGNINASQNAFNGTVMVPGSNPGSISITSNASGLTVGGTMVSQGDITLTAGANALTIKTGAHLLANEGNLRLINTNVANGSIVIGDISGSTTPTVVEAYTASNPALGNVSIYIGPFVQVAGAQPANVQVTQSPGGQVFWGTNSISAVAPINDVKALGRTVTFSRPAGRPITVNGSVTISADPPVTSPLVVIPPPPNNDEFIAALFDPNATPLWTAPPELPVSGGSGVVTPLSYAAEVKTALPIAPKVDFVQPLQGYVNHSATSPIDTLGGVSLYTGKRSVSHLYKYRTGKNNKISVEEIPSTITASGLRTAKFGGCVVKYVDSVKMTQDETGLLSLDSGKVLITASKPLLLRVNKEVIRIAEGSTVLVGNRASDWTVVRTIYDTHRHAVQLVSGKNSAYIGVGEEAMVSGRSVVFSPNEPRAVVGRRRIQHHALAQGITLVRAEVSLSSLMAHNSILSSLMRSENKDDQDLVSRLTKMSACVMLTTAHHGSYTACLAQQQ